MDVNEQLYSPSHRECIEFRQVLTWPLFRDLLYSYAHPHGYLHNNSQKADKTVTASLTIDPLHNTHKRSQRERNRDLRDAVGRLCPRCALLLLTLAPNAGTWNLPDLATGVPGTRLLLLPLDRWHGCWVAGRHYVGSCCVLILLCDCAADAVDCWEGILQNDDLKG